MYIIVTYLVKEKDLYCYIGKNNLELTPIIKLNFKIVLRTKTLLLNYLPLVFTKCVTTDVIWWKEN